MDDEDELLLEGGDNRVEAIIRGFVDEDPDDGLEPEDENRTYRQWLCQGLTNPKVVAVFALCAVLYVVYSSTALFGGEQACPQLDNGIVGEDDDPSRGMHLPGDFENRSYSLLFDGGAQKRVTGHVTDRNSGLPESSVSMVLPKSRFNIFNPYSNPSIDCAVVRVTGDVGAQLDKPPLHLLGTPFNYRLIKVHGSGGPVTGVLDIHFSGSCPTVTLPLFYGKTVQDYGSIKVVGASPANIKAIAGVDAEVPLKFNVQDAGGVPKEPNYVTVTIPNGGCGDAYYKGKAFFNVHFPFNQTDDSFTLKPPLLLQPETCSYSVDVAFRGQSVGKLGFDTTVTPLGSPELRNYSLPGDQEKQTGQYPGVPFYPFKNATLTLPGEQCSDVSPCGIQVGALLTKGKFIKQQASDCPNVKIDYSGLGAKLEGSRLSVQACFKKQQVVAECDPLGITVDAATKKSSVISSTERQQQSFKSELLPDLTLFVRDIQVCEGYENTRCVYTPKLLINDNGNPYLQDHLFKDLIIVSNPVKAGAQEPLPSLCAAKDAMNKGQQAACFAELLNSGIHVILLRGNNTIWSACLTFQPPYGLPSYRNCVDFGKDSVQCPGVGFTGKQSTSVTGCLLGGPCSLNIFDSSFVITQVSQSQLGLVQLSIDEGEGHFVESDGRSTQQKSCNALIQGCVDAFKKSMKVVSNVESLAVNVEVMPDCATQATSTTVKVLGFKQSVLLRGHSLFSNASKQKTDPNKGVQQFGLG